MSLAMLGEEKHSFHEGGKGGKASFVSLLLFLGCIAWLFPACVQCFEDEGLCLA